LHHERPSEHRCRQFDLLGDLKFSPDEELIYAGFLDDIDPSFILAVCANKLEHSSYLYIAKITKLKTKKQNECLECGEHDEEQ